MTKMCEIHMFLVFKWLIPFFSSSSNCLSMKNISFGLIWTKVEECHDSIQKTNTEKYNCTLCRQYNQCSSYPYGNIIHGEDHLQLPKTISVLIFPKAMIFLCFLPDSSWMHFCNACIFGCHILFPDFCHLLSYAYFHLNPHVMQSLGFEEGFKLQVWKQPRNQCFYTPVVSTHEIPCLCTARWLNTVSDL